MTEETGDVELASRSQTSRRRSAVPQQVALRKFPSQERDSVSEPSKKIGTAQESKVAGACYVSCFAMSARSRLPRKY